MRVIAVAERACLVEVDGALEAASLATWARSSGLGAVDVVPAATTVLFDGVDPAAVAAVVPRWTRGATPRSEPPVSIPVTYDGPDLDLVAGHWGCSVDEVVALHSSTEVTALFCGFAPGFSYLGGLPPDRRVPRLDTPRRRVEAGSVALADGWCGIYPTASPGGWLVIGTTDARLWDPDRDEPALLPPGTRVQFHQAPLG